MGIDGRIGTNDFRFGYDYETLYGRYIKSSLDFYSKWMSQYPQYIWGVQRYTNLLNSYTTQRYFPIAYSVTFPGNSYRYGVIDTGLYPEHIVRGESIDYLNIGLAQNKELVSNMTVDVYATQISLNLKDVKGMAYLSENKYLSEESKNVVKALVASATSKLTLLEKHLKNENGLSAEELNTLLAAMLEDAKALVADADEKFAAISEEITQAEKDVLAEMQDGLEEDLEGASSITVRGSGAASGSSTGKKVEELSEDDELTATKSKSRYGMSNEASVPACDNAGDLASSAVAEDLTTKTGFDELFGKDKSINEKNIVEVLDVMSDKAAFVDKLIALKDGDKDYSSQALKEIVKLLNARLTLLVNAGHIKETDKNIVKAHIANLTSYASNVSTNKTSIVSTLETIINTLKNKGTEEVVTAAIEAKQAEAQEQAKKEFREDYAKKSDNTYDGDKTYVAFPEEIKYLPNKKLFQVTIKVGSGSDEKTYYFEGGNFEQINKAIVACENDDVITKWSEIKRQLLTEETSAE